MYPLVVSDLLHSSKEPPPSLRSTAGHPYNNRELEGSWAGSSQCYQSDMETADALRHNMPKEEFFDFPPSEQQPGDKKMPGFFESEAPSEQPRPEEATKETNNNHLMMSSVDIVNYVDSNFWPCGDNTILEELNSWSGGSGQGKGPDNTDGTIYTLTVLNGGGPEQPGWFKPEENKEERLPHPPLDLESLLNIIPNNFPTSYQPETSKPSELFEAPSTAFQAVKEEPMEVMAMPHEFSNNNEWKENNNEVDSLLRNALQGKGFSRYNGVSIVKTEPKLEEKKEEEKKMVHIEAPMMYETTVMHDSDNPSSAQSMDDIFLSQLDVSYPEDYEKLKRIETEVAESVEQYYLERAYVPSVQMSLDPILLQKPVKKYTKRNKSGASGSSGVRKERSLHYCNICNKGFKDKYSVNVHIRTHTGEKPFTCSLCGKSFRQKAHLAKHYQTHMAQAKSGIAHKSAKSLIPTTT